MTINRAIAIAAMMLIIAYVAMFLSGCVKRTGIPTPQNTGAPVTQIAVQPYDFVSPFVCTISASNLTCMASMDVRFRRGQLETQIARGHQFSFHTPTGTGSGTVWFGCAGNNTCGPGYFMYGSPNTGVTPVEPARYWQGGSSALVPYGSLGIIEVDINNGQFAQIRNRWAGSIAPLQMKEGPGIVLTCTDQACTISLK